MVIKLAILLVIALILTAIAVWAFLPARYLPGNRSRHLRIRLHLRLHPGKGFAHLLSLWLRWGRLAVLRHSSRIRPSLAMRYRFVDSRQQAVFLGRAHYRHGPQHIGGVPSTFCWSPVEGCEDPATAIRRADAFAFAGAAVFGEGSTPCRGRRGPQGGRSREPARTLPRPRAAASPPL